MVKGTYVELTIFFVYIGHSKCVFYLQITVNCMVVSAGKLYGCGAIINDLLSGSFMRVLMENDL